MSCTINGQKFDLNYIYQLGLDEFKRICFYSFPSKLYKYFPNTLNESKINFSHEAIKNNSVYMQSPDYFDDPFDCTLLVNDKIFMEHRLKYYLKKASINFCLNDTIENLTQKLYNEIFNCLNNDLLINSEKQLLTFFKIDSEKTKEDSVVLLFVRNLIYKLTIGKECYDAIQESIKEESKHIINPKGNLRVSCFTTSPYLIRMWSTYADYHKGFCLEYDCDLNQYDINNIEFAKLFFNTLPVIYTDEVKELSKEQNNYLSRDGFNIDDAWIMYFYGALRKNTIWKDQNEWRYILPNDKTLHSSKNYDTGFSVPFFKISKVYLGQKMSIENRKEIIKLCNDLKIPYIGITISKNNFELIDCDYKCENCTNVVSR